MTTDWSDTDFAPAYPDRDVTVTPLGGAGTVTVLGEIHGEHHFPILRVQIAGQTVDIPLSAAAAATLGAEMLLVAGRCQGRAGRAAADALEGDLRHPPRVQV